MSATTYAGQEAAGVDGAEATWPPPVDAGSGFRSPAPRSVRDGLSWQGPGDRTGWEGRVADDGAMQDSSVVYCFERRAAHVDKPFDGLNHSPTDRRAPRPALPGIEVLA